MSYGRKIFTLLLVAIWIVISTTALAQDIETFRDARSGKVIFLKNRPAIGEKAVKAAAESGEVNRTIPQAFYLAEGWRGYYDPPPAPSGEVTLPGEDTILVSDAFIEAHGRLTRSPTFIWQGHRLRTLQEAGVFANMQVNYAGGCN
jgi:hypothetical protein